ncbi:MAG TPA: hypothetical protein VIJ55_14195 [Acetobacteraceae bacterium]
MSPSSNADDATDQVAHLRAQVEALMNERVTPALADAASRAESALCAMRGQADTVSGYVKDQPLPAVLAAAVVGFIAGRVFR